VYFQGRTPTYIPGEYQLGMTKEPIEIIPSNPADHMDPASRLRFSKTFPVEWNVKVKDIGLVHPEHMSKLVRYWREEDTDEDGDTGEGEVAGTYEV
jgi:hypothetical protein